MSRRWEKIGRPAQQSAGMVLGQLELSRSASTLEVAGDLLRG